MANLDLKSFQEDDRDRSLIRGWLKKGEKPGTTDISRESYVAKTLVSQWKRLEIHEGLVVRKYKVHDEGIINWQAIVPHREDLCLDCLLMFQAKRYRATIGRG